MLQLRILTEFIGLFREKPKCGTEMEEEHDNAKVRKLMEKDVQLNLTEMVDQRYRSL